MSDPSTDKTCHSIARSLGYCGPLSQSAGHFHITLYGVASIPYIGPYGLFRLCNRTPKVVSVRDLTLLQGAFQLECETWVESLIPTT
jgi:hypothetical protein